MFTVQFRYTPTLFPPCVILLESHANPADWQTFFAVQAGAAATLTGLVFVAASINLTKIFAIPGLPGRVAESMLQFLQVFFVSSVMLIPRQSLTALGYQDIFVAVLAWCGQFMSQVRYARFRANHPRKWLMQRIVTTNMASIPLFAGSIALLLGNSTALHLLVAAFFFSFVAGIIGAWILLIEILR